MFPVRPLVIVALLFCNPVIADDLQFIISGKAYHIGDPAERNLNEDNDGVGFQYDFDRGQDWIPVINVASLKDSNDRTTKYIGGGIKRRFQIVPGLNPVNFDAGVLGLAMTRKNYNDEKPFFGAVPFVSLGNDIGGINLTYVPPIEEGTFPFWYFQFSLKLAEF